MKTISEYLSSIGLDEKEVQVYIISMRLGTTRVTQIAKRCKLPRSTVHYICDQLVEKQLMRLSRKGNIKSFTAESPESIRYLLGAQRDQINYKEEELNIMLPELERIYNPHTILPKVTYYEGVEGIIKMFEDVLEANTPLLGATSITNDIHPEILNYLEKKYIPKRKALKNMVWAIYNDNPKTREYQKMDKEMNRISLLVPEKDFPFNSCCHIYDGKVVFYSFNENDITGVMIKNSIIYETQTSLFKLAWERAGMYGVNKKYSDIILPSNNR